MMKLRDLLLADLGPAAEIRANGEEHRACPKCQGGIYRFIVWPDGERGYCRRCGWKPDGIQYLRDIKGMTFREAAAEVGKELQPPNPKKDREERDLRHEFLVWRELHFIQSYQALRLARKRVVNVQFAQRCFQLAPSTFSAAEKAAFSAELLDATAEFQAMQTAFLLMSKDGDKATAMRTWNDNRSRAIIPY